MENNTKMNKDLSACTGIIKGGAKSCPQKSDCKRYLLHLENPSLKVFPVPYQAVNNGVCSFKK
jgi:hypothetical protein